MKKKTSVPRGKCIVESGGRDNSSFGRKGHEVSKAKETGGSYSAGYNMKSSGGGSKAMLKRGY